MVLSGQYWGRRPGRGRRKGRWRRRVEGEPGGLPADQPRQRVRQGVGFGARRKVSQGFIHASLASHYPRICSLRQTKTRPGLLGGVQRRVTADSGFRLGAGDLGGTWKGPGSPGSGTPGAQQRTCRLWLHPGACACRVSPAQCQLRAGRLLALGGEGCSGWARSLPKLAGPLVAPERLRCLHLS